MKLSFFAVLFVWVGLGFAAVGCGGDQNSRQNLTNPNATIEVESEVVRNLDTGLEGLEEKQAALDDKLAGLHDSVVDKIGEEAAKEIQFEVNSKAFNLAIDDKNVIRLNGIVLSRSDLEQQIRSRGKEVCSPTPVIVVDPAANYDTIAWLLESIYNEGCTKIDIVD